jgi:O-antigen/teichoic acid export membrane protein
MISSAESGQTTALDTNVGSVILRNTLIVTAGTWLIKILNLAFTIYVVRALGEAGMGQYATVTAFVGLFSVFFELGLTQYVERAIAQDRSRAQALFWNLVAMRLILAALGMIGIGALAFQLGYAQPIIQGILLFTATFLLAAFLTPLTALLTAHERFEVITLAQIVNQLVTMVLGSALLLLGVGYMALLYTGFVAMPLQIWLCARAIRRYQLGPLRVQIASRTWPAFIRASLPFGVTSLALAFNYNVDTVILGWYHSIGIVGWYKVAYGLVVTIVSVADGFLNALTPSLAREHTENADGVAAWVGASVYWLALVALPIATGLALLATEIVTLLYGTAYVPAGPLVALICWDVPLMLLIAFCGNVSAAVGLERPAAAIFLGSAVLNLAWNVLFIPLYGAYAAAAVTVATDAISLALFYIVIRRRMRLNLDGERLLRIIGAAALMAGVVWIARPLGLFAAVASGATSYLVLALALRAVDVNVLRMIAIRLRQRFGAR